MHDNPLVVPPHQTLGLGEHFTGMREPEVSFHVIHHGIVESEHRHMHLRDDQVFIIPWIAEQRGVLTVPRQVETQESTR